MLGSSLGPYRISKFEREIELRRSDTASYKVIDASPRFLAVDLEKKLLPESLSTRRIITCSSTWIGLANSHHDGYFIPKTALAKLPQGQLVAGSTYSAGPPEAVVRDSETQSDSVNHEGV